MQLVRRGRVKKSSLDYHFMSPSHFADTKAWMEAKDVVEVHGRQSAIVCARAVASCRHSIDVEKHRDLRQHALSSGGHLLTQVNCKHCKHVNM